MKKIGIMTIHDSINYGACLQAWGLYKFLCNEGYSCEIIDLHRPIHKDFIPSTKFKPYRITSSKKSITILFKEWINNNIKHLSMKKMNEEKEKIQKFKEFNSKMQHSKPYRGIDELYKNPPQYDIYITGSDQVWNPTQPFCIEPYFLTFVNNPNAIKISYASSIGLNELRPNEIRDFSKWLNSYTAISVREKEAQELLQPMTNTHIEVTADPTFLLGPDYWRSIAKSPQITSPYILVFRLSGMDIVNYGIKLGKESGKQVIIIPSGDNIDGGTTIRNLGLEEFLGYFMHADMVLTDSFHASVFSIIMGANNFFSYIHPNNKRGSRIINLLHTFDVSDHLLNPQLTQDYHYLSSKKIDKNKLYNICLEQMEKSRLFLRKNLR